MLRVTCVQVNDQDLVIGGALEYVLVAMSSMYL
jgi:hypothetical protein